MNKNKQNQLFEEVDPLHFNEESPTIATQVEKLENIVRTKFGKLDKQNNPKAHISFTQLRSLYDKIRQTKTTGAIHMLYPKIVYMAARQNADNNIGMRIIIEIAGCVNKIKSPEELASFKKFIEAIVAFQKYYYPSNN